MERGRRQSLPSRQRAAVSIWLKRGEGDAERSSAEGCAILYCKGEGRREEGCVAAGGRVLIALSFSSLLLLRWLPAALGRQRVAAACTFSSYWPGVVTNAPWCAQSASQEHHEALCVLPVPLLPLHELFRRVGAAVSKGDDCRDGESSCASLSRGQRSTEGRGEERPSEAADGAHLLLCLYYCCPLSLAAMPRKPSRHSSPRLPPSLPSQGRQER